MVTGPDLQQEVDRHKTKTTGHKKRQLQIIMILQLSLSDQEKRTSLSIRNSKVTVTSLLDEG